MRTYADAETSYSGRTRKIHRVTVVVEFDDFSSTVIGLGDIEEASITNNEKPWVEDGAPVGLPIVRDAPDYDLTIHVKGARDFSRRVE
jgi:hypothetical protein